MSPDDCRSHEITIREKYNIPEQYEVYGDKVLIPCHEYRKLKKMVRYEEEEFEERYDIPKQYKLKDGCVLVPYYEYRALKIIARDEEEEYEKSLFNIISEFYDKIQIMLVSIGAFLGIPSIITLFIIYAKNHVFDFTLFLMAFITGTLGLVGVMMPSNSKALMTVVKSSRRKKCE